MQKCMLRCLITFLCLSVNVFSQENYFQQEVNYKINVTLNDVSHSLKAFENIEYINNSNTSLTFIYFPDRIKDKYNKNIKNMKIYNI